MNNSFSDFSNSSVLLVDDEPGMRTALRANFLRHGWQVETADGVRQAADAIERRDFDLVVTDVRMRDGDGFEVMRIIRKSSPNTAVILLTAFGSVPEAVDSMKNGAFDYLTKPISFDQLQAAAARVMLRMSEQKQSAPVAPAVISSEETSFNNSGIVGRSPQLMRALQRARAAAAANADVLVEAESGTGKELLAKFIHDESNRSNRPFVAINCAAVPENLIESELFGHAKGAFTGATNAKMGKFESANGGTLLLDEIGEMPLNLQPKLLRVLQEREFERLGETRTVQVDVRVVATTNASLASMVEKGTFRSDLYYRLNVIPLSLPPLRERLEDVPALARHFAERFAANNSCAVPVMDAGFIEQLQLHTWPGNIRELSNFMRRVLSLNAGSVIDGNCFLREFRPLHKPMVAVAQAMPAQPIIPQVQAPSIPTMPMPGLRIAELEKAHLENTLALVGGNRTHAAAMLGISLRTVRNKIKEYGLPARSYA